MYLKSIEIVGFKSFADKTRVDLKPGITGIVGPNGCGKSNVMEAIRWSIGEMSWKSLRSDSMVSVIFAGTARRNPLSLAEVTLTFDNAQSLLPVQYSEVSITRRLFRSGESEYFLNKTQCRLRDIKELFLDTGLGSDGYAIIDQGGVDFVLSSKPQDRRALFEEAAGVAKYQAKREEALRKLERVEIDLARLADNISLINDQIKKLDSDARKAQLYQKYKEELAVLETRQLVQEAVTLEAEAAAEAALSAPAAEKLAQATNGLEAEEGRLAALNLERSRQEAVVMESNQRMAALKSEIGRLEERVEHADRARADIQAQLAASKAELEREQGRSAGLDPEIERARAAHDEAAAALEEAERSRAASRAALEKAEAAAAAAAERLETLRRGLMAAAEAAQKAARELSGAESRLGQFDYQVRQTLKEHERRTAQAEAAQAEFAKQALEAQAQKAWLEEAQQAQAGYERAETEMRASLSGLADEMLALHTETARLSAQTEALRAQGGRDPYWAGAHAALGAGIPGVIGTVRSLIKVSEADRPALEDALGERLYALVCEHSDAARAALEFLRASGKGRARCLVAGSLPERSGSGAQYPAGAAPLVDKIRYEPAHEKVVLHLLAEAYTLSGDLYGGHWVCGGSPSGEGFQLKLSDLESVEERQKDASARREELLSRRERWEADLADLGQKRREAAEAVQRESSKWHALEARRQQTEASARLSAEEAAGLIEEARRILADAAQTKERMGEAASELAVRRAEEESLRSEESSALSGQDALKEEAVRRRAEDAHVDAALRARETQRSFLKSQLDRLVMDKEALADSIERRRLQQEQWEGRLEELARTKEESAARLDENHRTLAGLEVESQALFAQLQQMLQSAQAMEAAIRERKAAAAELQRQLHASELKVSQLSARVDYLKGRLADEWKLSWEDARQKHSSEPVEAEKVQFLRRRIEALGNVNMAAPEEYEELRKKRDYLQGQVDDLNKAKEDLRSAIAKINATTRENFRQTFSEVREHFRKLYGILFEGGEADLVLTDQENLLDTGVEIVAQPPGKRLQSISLLSGGEKTLTAIALLFAFFMVKPSPICMLDEADAALDDANVDRFVSLLREFGSKIQFLLVSHNKKTMEACDVIYGVTMEESGVSQLISVDFRKKDSAQAPERSAEPNEPASEPSAA